MRLFKLLALMQLVVSDFGYIQRYKFYLQEKMFLKKNNIRTRWNVIGANSHKIKKEMLLLALGQGIL